MNFQNKYLPKLNIPNIIMALFILLDYEQFFYKQFISNIFPKRYFKFEKIKIESFIKKKSY